MDKRKLSRIERVPASADMMETAKRLSDIEHMVTAELLFEKEILQLTFYETRKLRKGKPDAAFRTFLSREDYITQDLSVSNVKWLTASLENMNNFKLFDSKWNEKKHEFDHTLLVYIRSDEELKLISDFFTQYSKKGDKYVPWSAVYRFQQNVKEKRLMERRKKETDVIDAVMDPIKEAPKEFFDWVWETGMSFSRYLIYKETGKGKAECECTHCKKIGVVDRKTIRLRNNEKGKCPFCGSKVTFKARGKMPAQTIDERWFVYVDPTPDGFIFRYFHAGRRIMSDDYVDILIKKERVSQYIKEYSRAIYTFPDGVPKSTSYEFRVYKQRGKSRWCPDQGMIACMECILYPGNLPEAWEHTPMKYSALEVLSSNIPTTALRYEDAIKTYIDFPKLEWLCKMGLNNIAKTVINQRFCGDSVGKINKNGKTIYEILGLTKVNTRILQEIDGNHYELRLLQVSQEIGLQFKPEQLKEYYETFECNTDLLKQANRKVSLHKLVKYIAKESENYPMGERGGCWQYSHMRYQERKDPRIERKQNMAHDWLEYLRWCRELGYDLDNMFIYLPKNFKKVHDRTAKEYQEMQDKKAAQEKKRREAAAKKRMEETKKAMDEIFNSNNGAQNAFEIKGKGLILVVPKSGDEIRAEGAALHHCVGGYVERVARGETMILFVRKAKEPDKPYFTMEWKDNHIVQCRGSHNCGMPPEVEAFVKTFERKMVETIKNGEENKRKRAG